MDKFELAKRGRQPVESKFEDDYETWLANLSDFERTVWHALDMEDESALKTISAAHHAEVERERRKTTVAGKEIVFGHTAVNHDMHLFINGYHNPDVCPECIQPGLLGDSAKGEGDE